jgi:hypothetical protein
MTTISLVPGGRYYGGANLPFFISRGMVEGWLVSKGFSSIVWHARSEPLPWDVNPRNDPEYDDTWDEWISASYLGTPNVISAPSKPSWLIVIVPSSSSANPGAAAVAAGQAAAAASAAASAQRKPPAVLQTGKPSAAPASGTPHPVVTVVGFLALLGGALALFRLRRRPRR